MRGKRQRRASSAGQPTWALVPLKNLARAKSRLVPSVDPATRRMLMLAMAEDVLAVLGEVRSIDRILLVSNEPEAGSLLHAAQKGALEVFYSADHEGLNRELEQAAAYAAAHGASRVLILHADLPWLNATAVERFLEECPGGTACAAQDKLGTGTNALLAPLPLKVPLVFGVESLPKFRTAAQDAGIPLHIVSAPPLEQDVDRPEDFARLLDELAAGRKPGAATCELIERLNLPRTLRPGQEDAA